MLLFLSKYGGKSLVGIAITILYKTGNLLVYEVVF